MEVAYMKRRVLCCTTWPSLWLDNIRHDLLNSGTLKRQLAEMSVTGLTSIPTIFDHAINSSACDVAIRKGLEKGEIRQEPLFRSGTAAKLRGFVTWRLYSPVLSRYTPWSGFTP
jgi:hypothetical protein